MSGLHHDTIVAAATAGGKAGVGIVRVSGGLVTSIAEQLIGALPTPRMATLRNFCDADGNAIDRGIVLYFPGPHSYTGEDMLELQGHGGPVIIDQIIRACCALGARPARAGEFSERAFVNDKMDLAQAEAVADLIDSGSAQAARAAMRSLQGEFSAAVEALNQQIITLRMHVEAAIDFPEEEIDFLDDAALWQRIERTRQAFDHLLEKSQQGRVLNDGLTVVLAGAPNVGKSSLLNRLTGEEAAIVTDIAGTTRDLIRSRVVIDGLAVEFIDTAGLRETDDVVEGEGIRRTRAAIQEADHGVLMADLSRDDWQRDLPGLLAELPATIAATLVLNKNDLAPATGTAGLDLPDNMAVIALSAKTGEGIDALRARLRATAGAGDVSEDSFSARRRHVLALTDAREAFERGLSMLRQQKAGELFAEELRLCQQALESLTGRFTSDDLLGKIFGEFCIGK